MKVTIDASELSQCIKYAQVGTGKTSQFEKPMIHFIFGLDLLTVVGHDGEIWTSRECEIENDETCSFLVDATSIALLATIDKGKVTITTKEGNRMIASHSNGKLSHQIMSDEYFPRPRGEAIGEDLLIDLNQLKKALEAVQAARTTKSGGSRWDNIFLEAVDGWLYCFATDSRRMHSIRICECYHPVQVILNPKVIKALRAVQAYDGDTVSISENQNVCMIKATTGHEICGAVTSYPWPKSWETIMNIPDGTQDIAVSSVAIEQALSRITSTRDEAIKCDIAPLEGGFMKLLYKSQNPPRAIEERVCLTQSCDFDERKIDAAQLQDAFKAIKIFSPEATMKYDPVKRFTHLAPILTEDQDEEMLLTISIAGYSGE